MLRGVQPGRHASTRACVQAFFILALLLCLPPGADAAPGGGRGDVRILGIRHFATTDYARVALILDRQIFNFESGILTKPARVFIDIPGGRLERNASIPQLTRRSKGPVTEIRFGRPKPDTLRIVIDLSSAKVQRRIFTLPNPDRIVIDLRSETGRSASASPPVIHPPAPRAPEAQRPSAARRLPPQSVPLPAVPTPSSPRTAPPPERKGRRELGLTARFRAGLGRVVIDPGHGGKDPGTIGLYGQVEKDLVLDLAKRTKVALRRYLPGNQVLLTRENDRFIELSDRTAFANEHDADVFVSIHANSAPQRHTSGLETYLLSEASTSRALRLAAKESNVSVAEMTDLQKILYDLMLRSKVTESSELAQDVHQGMVAQLRRRYSGVRDLGVKRGPFYVLVGAKMPSILTEVAFISNPSEARRVRTTAYRRALAEGIAQGIATFVGLLPQRAEATPTKVGKLRAAVP